MSVFKTALLLTVLTMLLIFGGQALAGQQGMTIALVMAFVMNIGAYFFSDKIALKSSGARPGKSILFIKVNTGIFRRRQTSNNFRVCVSTPLAASITMIALSAAVRVR